MKDYLYAMKYLSLSCEMCCLCSLNSDGGSGVSDVSLALGLTQHDTGLMKWVTMASTGGSGTWSAVVYVPDGVLAWVKLRVTDKG